MSPKTLTGVELDLDDAPARDSELFLVDGNNLAYRAYFALPEELATTEGFPTNALLGFTNMLFKLLSDYKPKGVAVAWDTRPVHRHAIAEREGVDAIVGDHHTWNVDGSQELTQLAPHRIPQRKIERGERLVEQDQPWIPRQRAGQRDALPLSA